MVGKYFQRPENVKKRALELLDVGKRERALDILYEFIRRGRHRQHNFSEKELEPILFMYLDLCVELKKSYSAKEGLFQYRNFCQNVNVASLENVVRGYLNNAEKKTDAARQESKEAVEEVDDLENPVSPQELLLSAVSGEDSQDRSDRTILTPWVKFLWESYRQCLELLKTNSRVESLYHDTALQAFRFCVKYQRKTEFRKLCEILRKHLDQLKVSSANTISLTNPETLARNMETLLLQLDHAIALEMWQEAYRSIYELHGLMTRSKVKPKTQMLANYFRNLSLVFAKAGNMLFHAASVLRLFQLSRDLKKNISADDLKLLAGRVLLAVLSVPLTATHLEFDSFIENEKNVLDKSERLASFFHMAKVPTRESLLKDIGRFSILSYVSGDLRQLYDAMEATFSPLTMCDHVQRVCQSLLADEQLQVLHWYVQPLQLVAQLRFVKQMGQVYRTVSLQRLVQLCPFTDHCQLQRVIVDAVRRSQLQIRIDHRQQAVHFGAELSEFQREDPAEGPTLQPMPSEQIRIQLMLMSSVLTAAQRLANPDYRQDERATLRAAIHHNYHSSKQREAERVRDRLHHIEQHKEMMETINSERVFEERSRHEQLERQKMAEEMRRLEREATEREKKRRDDELRQIAARHLKTRIAQISQTSVGQKVISKLDEEELLKMDADEILARQREELDKERRELAQKLATQWRRIDHVERAKRLEEMPLLQAKFEKQAVEDAEIWQEQQKQMVAQAIEDHQLAVKHKQRLTRMMADKNAFVDKLKAARSNDFEEKLASFERRLQAARAERLERRRQQRVEERRQRWLQERRAEQQRRRDEEAKRAREEQEREERERLEAEKAEYAKRCEKLDAIAAKQLAKERDIEERQKDGGWRARESQRLESWRPPAGASRPAPSQESWRSSVAGPDGARPSAAPQRAYDSPAAGDEGSWRRRNESSTFDRARDYGPRRVDEAPRGGGGSWRREDRPRPTDDDRELSWRSEPRRINDGPRRMDDGPRRMDDGPRRMDDGPRRMDDGPRRMDDGPRRMDDGPRRMDDGPRRMDDGPRRMDDGPRRMDDGPRRMDDGPRRMDDGPRRSVEGSWRSEAMRSSGGSRGVRADDAPMTRNEAAKTFDSAAPPRESAWRARAPKEEKKGEDDDGGWTRVGR